MSNLSDDLPKFEDDAERERKVEAVRPFWEDGLSKHERYGYLNVPLRLLQRAASRDTNESLAEGESMERVLQLGLERMRQSNTFKRWSCVLCGSKAGQFELQQSFKEHMRLHLSRETSVESFPAEDRTPSEEEKAFRLRMQNLHEEVRDIGQRADGDTKSMKQHKLPLESQADACNRAKVEAIAYAIEQLAYEGVGLEAQVEEPLGELVLEFLLPQQRHSRDSNFEPMDLFALEIDDVCAAFELVTDRIQEFSMDRLDSSTSKQEQMDDVDLFELDDKAHASETSNASGSSLRVNSKWITHLEQRRMDSDGKIEPLDNEGTECPRGGLILDWIFGKIVNTAEKSRCAVQTNVFGQQLPDNRLQEAGRRAFRQLCDLTKELSNLEQWAEDAKQVLHTLLEAKKREDVEEEEASIRRAQEVLAIMHARTYSDKRREVAHARKRIKSEYQRYRREVDELDKQRSIDRRTAQQLQQQRQEVAQQCAAKERAMQELSQKYEHAVKSEEHVRQVYHLGLFTPDSSDNLIANLRQKLDACDKELERYRVSYGHLEFKAINLCCSDPGMHINMRLARPLLQRGIEVAANQRAEEQAKRAEQAILAELEQESSAEVQQQAGKKRARKRSKRQRSPNSNVSSEQHNRSAGEGAQQGNITTTSDEETSAKLLEPRLRGDDSSRAPESEYRERSSGDTNMHEAKEQLSGNEHMADVGSFAGVTSFEQSDNGQRDARSDSVTGEDQRQQRQKSSAKSSRSRRNRRSKAAASKEAVEGALFAHQADARGGGKAATISELYRSGAARDTPGTDNTRPSGVRLSSATSSAAASAASSNHVSASKPSTQEAQSPSSSPPSPSSSTGEKSADSAAGSPAVSQQQTLSTPKRAGSGAAAAMPPPPPPSSAMKDEDQQQPLSAVDKGKGKAKVEYEGKSESFTSEQPRLSEGRDVMDEDDLIEEEAVGATASAASTQPAKNEKLVLGGQKLDAEPEPAEDWQEVKPSKRNSGKRAVGVAA